LVNKKATNDDINTESYPSRLTDFQSCDPVLICL